MAFRYVPSGSGGATPSGVTVVTPVRQAIGSGGGGGRVTGDNLAAVGHPLIGPNPGGNPALPSPPTGLGTPLGNPNFPCAAGPEIQPTGSTTIPIDTGTGYYFRHLPNSELSGGDNSVLFTTEFSPASVAQQHMVAFDYYPADITPNGFSSSQIYNAPVEYVLPPLAIKSFSGAPTWNPLTEAAGVGTQLNAVSYIGGECLRMDGSAGDSINIQFDPSSIINDGWLYASTNSPGGRIVQLKLRYRAWRQSPGDPAGTADPAPSEGLAFYYQDTGYPGGAFNVFLSAWLVPSYYSVAGDVVVKSLGEVNYGARGLQPDHAAGELDGHTWTVEDLNFMAAAGPVSFKIQALQGTGANQRYLYLDHIEMVAEIVPEERLACAVRIVSSVYNSATQIWDNSYLRFNKGHFPGSATLLSTLATTPQCYYDLCIREALPIDTSDLLQVQPNQGLASLFEPIGPSLEVFGIMQAKQTQENQLQTFTGTVVNGQLSNGVLTPFESVNMSVAAFFADFATTGAFWASYRNTGPQNAQAVYGATVSSLGSDQIQRVWLNGGTTYSYVQAVVQAPQPFSNPGPIQFYVVDATTHTSLFAQTAPVPAATVNALPDVGNGWSVVEVPLVVPFTPPTSAYYALLAFSTQPSSNPWLLAVGNPTGYNSVGYAATVAAFSYDVPGQSPASLIPDHAMALFCAMGTPATPVVTVQTTAAPTLTCDTTTISWAQLQWPGDGTIMAYGVQVSTDDVHWTTLAIVETGGSTATQAYNDYAAPWDIPVYYRLQGYRPMDRLVLTGAAAAPVTVASGGAVLGFSTSTQAFSYSPVDPAQVTLQWTDLNSVTLVQLHGEGFQRALRDTEDRGLQVTMNLLIANLGSCTPGAITVAQQSLAETPYEQLRALQQTESILVRFPGGPVRRMTIQFGTGGGSAAASMTVYTASGVYLAQVTLTDVNVDPLLFSANELPPGVV